MIYVTLIDLQESTTIQLVDEETRFSADHLNRLATYATHGSVIFKCVRPPEWQNYLANELNVGALKSEGVLGKGNRPIRYMNEADDAVFEIVGGELVPDAVRRYELPSKRSTTASPAPPRPYRFSNEDMTEILGVLDLAQVFQSNSSPHVVELTRFKSIAALGWAAGEHGLDLHPFFRATRMISDPVRLGPERLPPGGLSQVEVQIVMPPRGETPSE